MRCSSPVLLAALLLLFAVGVGPHAAENGGAYLAVRISRLPESEIKALPEAELLSTENQLNWGFFQRSEEWGTVELGLDYQYTRYENDNIEGRNSDLHRLQFPLRFTTRAGQWQVAGHVAPGVATSSNVFKDLFDRGTSDDLLVTAHVVARQEWDNHKVWLIGLAFDRAFGDSRLYPVAGIEYMPDESLHVRLAFPYSGIRYVPAERHAFTARIYPAGHKWHVVSDELNDEFDYRVEAIRSDLNWQMRIRGQIYIDLTLGYEFDRHHQFVDDTGSPVDSNVDGQFVAGIGFSVGAAPLPFVHGSHQ